MPTTPNPTLVFVKVPGASELLREDVHLTIQDRPIDLENAPLGAGRVLVKTLAVSSDPYMRYRFREKDVPMFCPPVQLGDA